MAARTLALVVVSMLALVACEKKANPPPAPAAELPPAAGSTASVAPVPAKAETSFVDRKSVV